MFLKALVLGCVAMGVLGQVGPQNLQNSGPAGDIGPKLYGNFYNDRTEVGPNVGAVDTSRSFLVNGNFENPKLGSEWRLFSSAQVPGWSSPGKIEIGTGSIYNVAWGNTHVAELSADIKRSEISQSVNLQQGHYRIVL